MVTPGLPILPLRSSSIFFSVDSALLAPHASCLLSMTLRFAFPLQHVITTTYSRTKTQRCSTRLQDDLSGVRIIFFSRMQTYKNILILLDRVCHVRHHLPYHSVLILPHVGKEDNLRPENQLSSDPYQAISWLLFDRGCRCQRPATSAKPRLIARMWLIVASVEQRSSFHVPAAFSWASMGVKIIVWIVYLSIDEVRRRASIKLGAGVIIIIKVTINHSFRRLGMPKETLKYDAAPAACTIKY